jgi:hypothetical protein
MSSIHAREPSSPSLRSVCRHGAVAAATVSTSHVSVTTSRRRHRTSSCHVVDRRVQNLERLGHVHVPVCRDRLGCGVQQARVRDHVATETDAKLDLRITRRTASPRLSDRLDDLAVRLYGSGIVGIAGEGPASQVDHVVGLLSDPRWDAYPLRDASLCPTRTAYGKLAITREIHAVASLRELHRANLDSPVA